MIKNNYQNLNKEGFMKTLKLISTVLVIIVLFAYLTGCASSRAGDVYARNQAARTFTVETGVIESIRPIRIEGTKTPIGAAVGALAGGVIGNTIGGGSGRTAATVFGGLAGAGAGAVIEEGLTRENGLEIIVKKDNGQTIAIVQGINKINKNMFNPGDRIRIIRGSDGSVRVSK